MDVGDTEKIILSLDEITDREGRFRFEPEEPCAIIRPPDNINIRGELINRLNGGPLPDAKVYITFGGDDGRPISAVTDYRGRFAAGEVVSDSCRGAPEHRRQREPLWTQVERDHGPQFYEWNMGWDDG
jgi:hypothetical protein